MIQEKPILFKTPMVQAILDGRKTQTRRIMDYPKSFIWNSDIFKKQYSFDKMYFDDRKNQNVAIFEKDNEQGVFTEWFKCPYQVGMKLYVREKFRLSKGDMAPTLEEELLKEPQIIYYESDNPKYRDKSKWKPSIFMPKKCARIWLEITDVRVERIQDISSSDAWNESVQCGCMKPTPMCKGNIDSFEKLWDSINKKRGFGWDTNCWVWVIEFKRIKP